MENDEFSHKVLFLIFFLKMMLHFTVGVCFVDYGLCPVLGVCHDQSGHVSMGAGTALFVFVFQVLYYLEIWSVL